MCNETETWKVTSFLKTTEKVSGGVSNHTHTLWLQSNTLNLDTSHEHVGFGIKQMVL